MANFNSNPNHVAKIGYNGFDMGHSLKFSSTVGELLPVYYDILQPGDKVSLKSIIKTRTMPLESAAMVTIKEHVEWFFVPLEQIYHLFGDWYFGIQDFNSSLFRQAAPYHRIPFFEASHFTKVLDEVQSASDPYFGSTNPHLIGMGVRLLEHLGVNMRYRYGTASGQTSFPLAYCPILACAYQKIFYDFYRDSEREKNEPFDYNLDMWYDSASIPVSTAGAYNGLFTLRYRRWRADFFTHTFVSPLFGATSTNAFSQDQSTDANRLKLTQAFSQWLVSAGLTTYKTPGINTANSSPNTSDPTVVGTSGLGSFTVQPVSGSPNSVPLTSAFPAALSPTAIRTSFAVQKLLEVTRRAGKHYDAQQLAHFGVKLNRGISGECVFIGGSDSEIIIGDVISTAETAQQPLGTIAGKGYNNSSSRRISYEAPCHGVLMAIYSAEPVRDYSDRSYDYLNTLMDRSAWPSPEFDNLGMQPLFRYQSDMSNDNTYNNSVLGFKYRYFPFKAKFNKTLGALSHSLYYWAPQTTAVGNTLSSFYIRPDYLDDIMVAGFQFEANVAQASQGSLFSYDPLLHELYLDVKKSSKMSTFGLEQL